MIEENTFREDLYYRINVFSITLPPLRERKESIPYLISLFIAQQGEKLKKDLSEFSNEAQFALISYDYPGNIRELRNIIEHAAIVSEKSEILFEDLPDYLQKFISEKYLNQKNLAIEYNDIPLIDMQKTKQDEKSDDEELFSISSTSTLNEVETAYIKFILKKCKNNYSKAVKTLGISRSTIWRKLNYEHS
jgi:transcriptional regulator with PAS, ATPase and Fis domain